MTLDSTLSGRPYSHGEGAGVKMMPPLVVRVDYAACAVAGPWPGTRGPTTWASRARGAHRKRCARIWKYGRAHLCRFSILMRVMWASTGPLREGAVGPAFTAA